MSQKYRLLKRDEDEESYAVIEEVTKEELTSIFAKLMQRAIVLNENYKGNPVVMLNLHSDDEPSIPDIKMFVTFEEVQE